MMSVINVSGIPTIEPQIILYSLVMLTVFRNDINEIAMFNH